MLKRLSLLQTRDVLQIGRKGSNVKVIYGEIVYKMFTGGHEIPLIAKILQTLMFVENSTCLKSKYLPLFSARWGFGTQGEMLYEFYSLTSAVVTTKLSN